MTKEELQKQIDNWEDLSLVGIDKLNNLKMKLWIIERKEDLKKKTGKELGYSLDEVLSQNNYK